MTDALLHVKQARRRKILLVLGSLLLLFIILILLAPFLISKFGKAWIERKASEKSGMSIKMGEISLSWWSPAKVQKLQVQGKELIETVDVDSVLADFSVFGWFFGNSSLSLELNHPVVVAKRKKAEPVSDEAKPTEEKSSEEAEEKSSAKKTSLPFDSLKVEVKEGKFDLQDEILGTQASLDHLQFSLQSNSKTGPVSLRFLAQIANPQGPGGQMSGGQMSGDGKVDLAKASGNLNFKLDQIDLAPWRVFLAPQISELQGKLQGNFKVDFQGMNEFRLDGKITADELSLRGPALGSETFVEKQIVFEPKLSADFSKMSFNAEGLNFSSSFASLVGKGAVSAYGEGNASVLLNVDFSKLPRTWRAKMPNKFATAQRLTSQLLIKSKEGKLPIQGTIELVGGENPPKLELQSTLDPERKEFFVDAAKLSLGKIQSELQAKFFFAETPMRFESNLRSQFALSEISRWVSALPKQLVLGGENELSLQLSGNTSVIKGILRSDWNNARIFTPPFAGPILFEKPVVVNAEFTHKLETQDLNLTLLKINADELTFTGQSTAHLDPDALFFKIESTLKGSLAGLQKWIPNLPSDLSLSGSFETRLAFDGDFTRGKAALLTTIQDLQASRPSFSNPYTEKLLQIDVNGLNFDLMKGTAGFEQLTVHSESKAIALRSKVSFHEYFQGMQASCTFDVNADAMKPLFSSLLPKDLSVAGQGNGNLIFEGKWREKSRKQFVLDADLRFPEITYQDSTWKNGSAKIETQGNVVTLKELTGELNGSPLEGKGSIDFGKEKPEFEFTAQCQQVPVKQSFLSTLSYPIPILASKDSHLLKVDSALDGKVSLKGQGSNWEEIKKTLKGDGKFAMGQGSLIGPSALKEILAGTGGAVKFEGLDAPFQITDGKILTPGIVLKLKESAVTMKGTTTLDGVMQYDVHVDLPPSLKEKKWGQQFEVLFGKNGLPVGLGGTVTNPKPTFKMPELKEAAKDLLDDVLDRRKKKKD